MSAGSAFLGTYTPLLDDKGRFVLPARFREQLAEGLVITKGQDKCLFGFRSSDFQRMADALREASMSARALRDHSRLFFGSASEEVPDRQGRVAIPAGLRTYAGITRELAVVGVGSRLELWDAAAWEQQVSATEDGFASAQEEVFPGVF